jgi:predicted glycogen debranching enzyme
MPTFRVETYGELSPWINREWLLTNGTGSFASSTVAGANTRRYHGLLVAATLPPVGRVLALSRLAETVAIEDHVTPIELSLNYFQSHLIPRGDRYLRSFEVDYTARFEYDADGVRIRKEILLCWGKPTVGIRYTIDPGRSKQVELRVQPFVALRDFHALMRKEGVLFDLATGNNTCSVARNGLKLSMRADTATFTGRPDWWYDHTYPHETERGLDDREDLFTPGYFSLKASQPTTLTLWASTANGLDSLEWEAERKKAFSAMDVSKMPTQTQKRLAHAANAFICKRKRAEDGVGATILAGFPWFADWGRDSMISLPGLLLSTGRFKDAGQVLSVFAGHVSDGMVPNYFDDYSNEPTYNTVDASLWFIHAAHEYLRTTRDNDLFESHLKPACQEIIEGYRDGTRYDIKMDPADGLISCGNPKTQLTWMDAKCGDIAFTPRHGKPVEINALWYNALVLLGHYDLATKVKESFAKAYWISPYRGLADVITGSVVDKSIRPNQIFAVSLPNSPLSPAEQKSVVEVVQRELLTPVGLRTLSPGEPGYQRKYIGNQFERDKAYHNGTIWPWLIGPFLDGYLRVHNRSPESKDQCRRWLAPLIASMEEGCLGNLSECFEADPPHRPVACVAQAWSVAEVLRLAIELEM